MARSDSRQLVFLANARQALEAATTLPDIKTLRDKAEAVRLYARSAALGLQTQNLAAEVKLRAERKAGLLLAELKLRGGDRRSHTRAERMKLYDLSISRDQSAHWQRQAAVPEEAFEEYLQSAKCKRQEITSKGLLRLAQRVAPAACRCKLVFVSESAPAANCAADLPATSREARVSRHPDERRHLESLREAVNHCRLLSQIVSDESPEAEAPAASQRRLMRRLVEEIHALTRRVLSDIERGT